MYKIKLLILLLINYFIASCTNNTGGYNFRTSVAYIGGEYDGLVLSNKLKSHLHNFGILDENSKYEVHADISIHRTFMLQTLTTHLIVKK